jgi:hypothetical protein
MKLLDPVLCSAESLWLFSVPAKVSNAPAAAGVKAQRQSVFRSYSVVPAAAFMPAKLVLFLLAGTRSLLSVLVAAVFNFPVNHSLQPLPSISGPVSYSSVSAPPAHICLSVAITLPVHFCSISSTLSIFVASLSPHFVCLFLFNPFLSGHLFRVSTCPIFPLSSCSLLHRFIPPLLLSRLPRSLQRHSVPLLDRRFPAPPAPKPFRA